LAKPNWTGKQSTKDLNGPFSPQYLHCARNLI
jgi:hypothetical protein